VIENILAFSYPTDIFANFWLNMLDMCLYSLTFLVIIEIVPVVSSKETKEVVKPFLDSS
jgi:hypothetical protein